MKKYINIILLTIITAIMISGCGNVKKNQELSTSKQGFFLNTFIDLKIFGTDNIEILNESFDTISKLEKILSVHLKDSEIQKINSNAGIEPVKVSEDTMYLMEKSLEYANDTGGLFDVTIYPLVDLWDITNNPHIPVEKDILAEKEKVDYKKIIIDKENMTVFLKDKDMKLDLGGIAKGYIGDLVLKELKSKGIEKGILNLGGNVILIGEKSDKKPWKIGIQDPNGDTGAYLGTLEISDKSIVTSGIYERYFEEDGKRYHHILNPYTGYPEDNELAGISIISNNSTDGDALSTSVFLLGLEKGIEYVNSKDGIEAIFITKDNTIFITDGIKDKFTLENETYEVK
jgi:thiamine biosynthesis lipoprotein